MLNMIITISENIELGNWKETKKLKDCTNILVQTVYISSVCLARIIVASCYQI